MQKESGGPALLCAADFGIRPGRDCAPGMRAALSAARELEEAGRSVVLSFAPDTYSFYPDRAPERTLYASNTDSAEFPLKRVLILLEGHKRLTVDGGGSLFLVHGAPMVLAAIGCEEVTLRNFSWDFAVPTVSEMTVRAYAEEDGHAATDFSVPPGCRFAVEGNDILWNGGRSPYTGELYWVRKNDHGGCTLNVYDRETDFLRRCQTAQNPFAGARAIRRLPDGARGEGRVRIVYSGERPALQRPGRTFEMLATPKRPTCGAFLSECRDVSCENLGVHFMHGFGFLAQMCRDVSFTGCRFEPRPGTGRRCSSFADSIHICGAAGGVRIVGCRFTHALDDAINIHGVYTRVERAEDDVLTLRYAHPQQAGFRQYHAGDTLEIVRRDTLLPPPGEGRAPAPRVVETVPPLRGGNDARTMTVRLDRAPDLSDDPSLCAVENLTYTPRVEIRSCRFEVLPTRGVLCTTRRPALIEDNLLRHLVMPGVYVSGDANDWYESGPVGDLRIRANRFVLPQPRPSRALAAAGPQDGLAAIQIHPETGAERAARPVHRNISVEQNEFYLESMPALLADGVDGLYARGNGFTRLDGGGAPFSRTEGCQNASVQGTRVLPFPPPGAAAIPAADAARIEDFCQGIRLPPDAERCVWENALEPEEYAACRRRFAQDGGDFFRRVREHEGWEGLLLHCMVRFAVDARASYEERNIPLGVYWDTFSDIALWEAVCFRATGRHGLLEYGWLQNHARLALFRLGRLQFQPVRFSRAQWGAAPGRDAPTEGQTVLNVHIPEGESLRPALLADSYRQAEAFFGLEENWFTCASWLLSPALRELLPENSHILGFQREYAVLSTDPSIRQAEERIFGFVGDDAAAYPEKTRLQRAARERLRAGGTIPFASGIRRGRTVPAGRA